VTKLEGRTSTTVHTVGHSNHSLESFLSVLKDYDITAIADVRSYPYSNANPHFDREALSKSLEKQGIVYVFLGKELGARTTDQHCYVDGKVQYERLADTKQFQEGLRRVQRGVTKYSLALMCAEGEPLDCHRTILVSRYLSELNLTVRHILRDGNLEDHDATMERLLRTLKLSENLVLRNKRELISEGYRIQGQRIAYELPKTEERKNHLSFISRGR
jgi:uncharacterized protein (DUF488 family)